MFPKSCVESRYPSFPKTQESSCYGWLLNVRLWVASDSSKSQCIYFTSYVKVEIASRKQSSPYGMAVEKVRKSI